MEYTPIGFDKECSEIRLYYKKNEDGTFDVDIPNFIVLDDNGVEHSTILKFSNVALDDVYDNEGVIVCPNKHIFLLDEDAVLENTDDTIYEFVITEQEG